jgi:2-keto-3-deoxy-L-rhamnonate aldolase RhmA
MNKSIKQKLKSRKLTVGSWITMGHSSVAEIMSRAGFEWLTVDMEHSALTLHQVQQLVQTIELCGAVPFVRVGENNANLIKRVLDTGAKGVIVPMVNTKGEAEAAVSAAKYPPHGKRGVGLARAQGYGFHFEEYKKWVDEECVVIAQIEHIKAIENLEDILNTRGIDGTIIGPYDLSGSLGYPGFFKKPEVRDAIEHYEQTCRKSKKPMGFHVVQPASGEAAYYIEKGYTFLAVGLDTLYLGTKCREVLGEVGAKD